MTEDTTQINKGKPSPSFTSQATSASVEIRFRGVGNLPEPGRDWARIKISSDKKFVEVVNYLHRKLRNPQSLVRPIYKTDFPECPSPRLMETPMVSYCLPMHPKRCLDSSHLSKMRLARPCLCTSSKIGSVHSLLGGESLPAKRTAKLAARSTDPFLRMKYRSQSGTFQQRRFEPWPLYAWQGEVEFSPARVVSNTPYTKEINRITLDIGERSKGHSTPGQFIQTRFGDAKPAFIALSSPPRDSSEVDLIVKCQGEIAGQLCKLEEGDEVDVSEVMGRGFQVDKIPPDQVSSIWMFATGTGIAPIKSLLESPSLQAEKRSSLVLYYGAKNEEASAAKDYVSNWSNNFPNLRIRMVYSDEGNGYIQDAFQRDVKSIDSDRAGVFLCGQRDMCESITQQMMDLGVPKERILLNF